jgi:putative tryptophan/tyrosine transport system substrate-binding protein
VSATLKRREFITLLGGAAAGWPLAAGAQPTERLRRIGGAFRSEPAQDATLGGLGRAARQSSQV